MLYIILHIIYSFFLTLEFSLYSKFFLCDLRDIYNSVDLFVLPSYYEALGCVYLESWATNTPFIAVKGQGIEEVMNDEMKELSLVEVEDVLDLSSKIRHFYTHNVAFEFNPHLKIENTIRNYIEEIENI